MSGFGGAGGMQEALARLNQQVTPQAEGSNADVMAMMQSEPANMNYGGMGDYNTLAQDMSRNQIGDYGFEGNQFQYSPVGDIYSQMLAPGQSTDPYRGIPWGTGQPMVQPGNPFNRGGGGGRGGARGAQMRMR